MRRILCLAACLCMLSNFTFSQVRCSNKLLTELTESLPDIGLADGFSGEKFVSSLSNDKPLIVQRKADGEITHIGISFFNRDVMAKHPSPIYHFIERYFLELLLLPSEDAIKTKLRQERVELTSEVYKMSPIKSGIRSIIAGVSPDLSVYITSNNHRYTVSCIENNRILAKIDFPVRYEMITGVTKLEAENSFYPDLLVHKQGAYQPLTEIDLSDYKDSYYLYNEDYYVMEDIIATSYYKKVGEEFVPILSSEMLSESVYNLFNAGYDWKVGAEVTQSLYGGKNNAFEVPLAQLMDFMKANKCSIYTGIRKFDKSIIEGVVMAANMELGYQHLLTFTFDKRLFDSPEAYPVKIKMYNYVPIHNISSLFGENKF